MFHATIHAPARRPFSLSGRVAPYDLEVLREHVRARRGPGTWVEVRLAAELRPTLLRALGDPARLGVAIVVTA